jgi:hypothetical protein
MAGAVDERAIVMTSTLPSLQLAADLSIALALALALGAIYLVDSRMISPRPAEFDHAKLASAPVPLPPEPPPLPARPPVDPTPRVLVQRTHDGRFGLVCLSGNPDDPSDDNKSLTFSPIGQTNNTRVMVDGNTPLFGDLDGDTLESWHNGPDSSMLMSWSFKDVLVRESVRLVPGDISNRIDTMRVTYELRNRGATTHQVGLRVMLDTLIGDNDGVPFIVPGRPGIVTSTLEMRGTDVPDFVQSLERGDLSNPGVIVDIDLVPAEGELRPSELVLSHWPGSDAAWNYDRRRPFGRDTAAGIYYAAAPLKPGQSRTMGFSYGLGTISSTSTRNARLSLTAGGPIRAGSSFWLVALVNRPRSGQTVNIVLPAGLSARRPESRSQPVEGSGLYTQVSWLIEVAPELLGEVQVEAVLEPESVKERQSLNIQPPNAQLSLLVRGPCRSGRPFWVSALVNRPGSGQSVTLSLPDGVTMAQGHAAKLPVGAPSSNGYAQVSWLVVSGPRVAGHREFSAQLAPGDARAGANAEIKRVDLTH